MPDTPDFLAERLLAEGEKSIAFFEELTPQHWEQIIYTDGSSWTPHQILAHFVTAEVSLSRLVENIASGGPGSPDDFDLNAYNERKVSELLDAKQNPSIEEMLASFRTNRHRTAGLVAQLTSPDLSKKGRHPFLGIATLAEIIKIIYRHNQIHQREMRQAFSQTV